MGRKPNHILSMDVLHGTEWLSKEWDYPAKYIGTYNKRTGKIKSMPEIEDSAYVDIVGSKSRLNAIRRYEAECSGCSIREFPMVRKINKRGGK